MASAALRGFLLGFAIAATPGPMFFLCLRRTLLAGRRAGLALGLGIATADTIYATLAAAGIGTAAAIFGGAARWIILAGGVALIGLGVKSATASPPVGMAARGAGGGASYLGALGLTLANPATIVAFAAIFAGIGLAGLPRAAAPLVVGGTALGSLTWWVVAVAGASALGRAAGPRATSGLALVSGLALAAFGAAAVVSVLR